MSPPRSTPAFAGSAEPATSRYEDVSAKIAVEVLGRVDDDTEVAVTIGGGNEAPERPPSDVEP